MQSSNPGEFTVEAVNLDVPSRPHTQFACMFPVCSVWIGEMQGKMKAAAGILHVNHILTFRNFVISFPLLGS